VQIVNSVAVVDKGKCSACSTCLRLCPVTAITLEKTGEKSTASVNEQQCLACTICSTRCPEHAIDILNREKPLVFGVDADEVSQEKIAEICHSAHMFPEQVICYCRRTQARDVAAAIIMGAKTPEEISRSSGARTGCGVLCITAVLRLLKAAGITLDKAPGYQWYNSYISIWDIPAEVIKKFPEYFLAEDIEAVNNIFPGGSKK
jgi:Pyruvate/2-oxoacid:ferredoxin oxidoreductase delta subunit/bacterioferritin-associated ferredoxin